jgi:vancomycin resistance protein YoaR
MTDLPNDAAEQAAGAPPPAPDLDTPVDDPELAALVQRTAAAAVPDTAASPAAFDTAPTEAVFDAAPVVPSASSGEPPAPPRRGRSLKFRFGVAFVMGLLLAVGVGAGALYAWGAQYDGRVLPGVWVGSTNIGGLTREQAGAAIANAYGSLGTGQVALTGPDGETSTISYADLDRGPDTEALLDAALAVGRQDEPLANLIGAPQAAIHGVRFESTVAYDHDKLAAAVKALAASIDQTPVDATVTADEAGTYTVAPSKDGRAVDQAALLAALDQQLATFDAPASIAMAVPVLTLPPTYTTATADAAKAAADRMAADLVVARGEDKWTVTHATLAPLVSISSGADGSMTPVFDETGLDPILKNLAQKVNQTPQDAGLRLVGGHVIATGASREGRTLKAADTKTAILAELAARQGGAAPSPVAAAVKAVDPKLSSADAKAFAPKMKMISAYSIYYWVIVNNHWGGNIEGPATVINGTVVPAGTKFDFWKVVGDLHNAPGVGPGNAIEGGKITVTGAFGGGICTTSTTLFNAAFRAGMVPLARQNHNEFIDRYPAGLDATVWIVGKAKQTMSFKNDTKYPILITRTVTDAGSKRWLTFKIWSVPNGRKAVVSDRVIQPGERAVNVTVKDPTKPVGYYFVNNSAVNGAKVWVTVSIYDHGKLHWRKRYFSNYPAVDGVTIVGTKKTAT